MSDSILAAVLPGTFALTNGRKPAFENDRFWAIFEAMSKSDVRSNDIEINLRKTVVVFSRQLCHT